MIPGLFGDKGEGGGGGFMMPNLFLVFLMSLGIVASEKSVRSHRPADTSEVAPVSGGISHKNTNDKMLPNQGVANYLWEDPLSLLSKTDGKTPPDLLDVYSNWHRESGDQKKLCLVVGLPGGEAPATVEKRLRIRSAVSSALLARGEYHFRYGESLQIAQWSSTARSLGTAAFPGGEKQENGIRLGYSRLYRPYDDEKKEDHGKYDEVFLLYVDEGAWGGDFGKNIMTLFRELRLEKDDQLREDWAYVGLTNSHRLHQFVDESFPAKSSGEELEESGDSKWSWENFRVITPHATVEDKIFARMFDEEKAKKIFEGIDLKQEHREKITTIRKLKLEANKISQKFQILNSFGISGERIAKNILQRMQPGELIVERMMAHDGMLAMGLIEELKERDIRPAERGGDTIEQGVLLLSEMDSFYGRSIAATFREKWEAEYDGLEESLYTIHYQLGLDGHQANPSDVPQEGNSEGTVQLGLAEGRSQIDSVARLVGKIRAIEKGRGFKFKAIGVLGSDVYDKLLLLRALRPEFQDARFFTTDLDARLWQGPERMASRNLIVASSPLFEDEHRVNVPVPPFRSHYQLSTYEAVSSALRSGELSGGKTGQTQRLGIFEIGKKGPIFLGGYLVKEGEIEELSPGVAEMYYPPTQFSHSHYSILLTMILGVFVYCIWPHVAPLWRRDKFENFEPKKWKPFDRRLVIVYSVIISLPMGFVIFLQNGILKTNEPLRLLDGVSVWPTVILDILVSMLALCWLLRSWEILDNSHNNLKSCFPFNSGSAVSSALEKAVKKFDELGDLKQRLKRTFWILAGYLVIYAVVFSELAGQNIQNLARGDLASTALEYADGISHACMAILLFFIADAVFQFSRAIQFGMVMVKGKEFDDVIPFFVEKKKEEDEKESKKKNEEEVKEEVARTWSKPGMSADDGKAIVAAIDDDCPQPYWQTSMLELAMKRANTIGSLLYYPFICLFLLFIAKNAVFDDFALSEKLVWTYVLVFALLAGAIIYSQIALKALFKQSSISIQNAIQNNPETVSKYYKKELEHLKDLEKKSNYRIFNNPLFKAAIIPIGGSGILELVSQIAPVLRGG